MCKISPFSILAVPDPRHLCPAARRWTSFSRKEANGDFNLGPNVSPTALHVSRTSLYCRRHPYPLQTPAHIHPYRRRRLNPTHAALASSPLLPPTPRATHDGGHEGGAEPGPGAVHGPVVRDRVLPVPVPAQGRRQHARHLHARPRRRRQGAERDLDRRPPGPHRGHGLPRRRRRRRGQAQGQVLRAPLPPRLPRHRRLLGAPRRRRLPVRARRPALPELPLDLVQAAADGRGRVRGAGGEGQGGRVRREQAPEDAAPGADAGEPGRPQGRRPVVDQISLWEVVGALPKQQRCSSTSWCAVYSSV